MLLCLVHYVFVLRFSITRGVRVLLLSVVHFYRHDTPRKFASVNYVVCSDRMEYISCFSPQFELVSAS